MGAKKNAIPAFRLVIFSKKINQSIFSFELVIHLRYGIIILNIKLLVSLIESVIVIYKESLQ